MEINIVENSDNILVTLSGSFDTLAAQQTEPQIKELEALASKSLTLDFSALDYIASSGLRMLLRLRKAAAAQGKRITLLHVNDNITEVLRVTHLDQMFILQ